MPIQDPHAVLSEQFGLDEFRPGQEEIISQLLAGRDVLAVLPTGAGKSLVFQLAAQLLPGLTVVVSPLLALMKDQIESIEERGIDASSVSSMQSAGEAAHNLEDVEQGTAKLLYVTPERFDNDDFMEQLGHTSVSLFVVDEAHCVSDWGHSFRPAYLTLADVARRHGNPTMLALTATATPWIRDDIIQRLGMRKPALIVRGNDRPNLFLEVRRVEKETDDKRVLHDLLVEEDESYAPELDEQIHSAMKGSGIIYTATTKAAVETVEWLTEWGIKADYYHGQRAKREREAVQDAFMADELRVIVATNAFGMGVDKADVRFVIHRDVPGSLEAYYQEAGRAGRDGEFARCTLIYRPGDLGRSAFLSGTGELTAEEVEQAWKGLKDCPEGTLRDLQAASGLSKGDVSRLVDALKEAGIVVQKRGRFQVVKPDWQPADVSLTSEDHCRAYEHSRREMMRSYAETGECRRRYILNYFGEEYPAEHCDRCDNDLRRSTTTHVVVSEARSVDSPFAMGARVEHATLGTGVVQRVTDDTITVLFDAAGYKTLSLEAILEQGLLQKS